FVDSGGPGNSIHVSFTRVGSTYHAKLALRGEGGDATLERSFADRAENCLHVAEALVLGTTLLLEDGTALLTSEAAASATTAATSTSTATPPSSEAALAAPVAVAAPLPTIANTPKTRNASNGASGAGSQPTRVSGELWVGSVLSSGVVSSEGLGWGMGVAGLLFPFGALGVKLGADYLIGDTIQRGLTSYQFSQTTAFVAAVIDGRLSERFRLLPEAGLTFGVTHAAVVTRNPTDPGDFPFLGMRLGAAARLRLLGPLTLSVGGHLRMPFYRHIFRASGLSEAVWEQSHLGFSAEVALGLRFE
ncbi:MAG TPA: hypothetical protein VIV60_01985, partial [Polyangiaceae bacterium]